VRYVLEASGAPGPTGASFVAPVGTEELYQVADASTATVLPLHGRLSRVPVDAPGTPVPWRRPGPASLRVVVDDAGPALLRLRVGAEPGWHATLDGRPLALQRWAKGVMLEARLPAGRHTVVLHYWPDSFTVGIVVALVAVGSLVTGAVAVAVRRWRSTRPMARGVAFEPEHLVVG
ncbi:MAG TPA: YfhO family protein, partial [Acidimicrobiales bacterium]|nr:YfhO family protein [Acidimicrobiales bacterium]